MALAKKILYIIAGIIKVAIAGFAFLVSVLIVFMRGVFASALKADPSIVNEMVDNLINGSSEYAFLSTYSLEERIEYILGIVSKFGWIVLIISIVWIAVAVFLFILSKRITSSDYGNKLAIILTIVSWIVSPLTISTILTTIACALKKRKAKIENINIEAYQE